VLFARTPSVSSDASCRVASLFRSTRHRGPRYPLHVNDVGSSGPKRLPFDECAARFGSLSRPVRSFARHRRAALPPRFGFHARSTREALLLIEGLDAPPRLVAPREAYSFRLTDFRRFSSGVERARRRLPSIRSASTIRRIDRTPRRWTSRSVACSCGPASLLSRCMRRPRSPLRFRAVPGCVRCVRGRRRSRVRQRDRRPRGADARSTESTIPCYPDHDGSQTPRVAEFVIRRAGVSLFRWALGWRWIATLGTSSSRATWTVPISRCVPSAPLTNPPG